MTLLEELEQFIKTVKEGRELRRALAVKMQLQRKPYQEIQNLLQVSQSFINHWKTRAIFEGVESLRLQYKGRKSYLSTTEKQEVIQWLRTKNNWDLEKLQLYIEQKYNMIFESNQSYYNLFKEAGIS